MEELHTGAKTMIYYFHYCNKGSHPFTQSWMTEKNLALAQLNTEQAEFLKESSKLINERCMCAFCSSEALKFFHADNCVVSTGIQENSREWGI